MRRLGCLLLSFALALASASAKEDAAGLPEGLSEQQAVEITLAAHAAGDRSRLEALAQRTDPDPWIVAETLCRRGAWEAALALGRAGAAPAVTKLAAYVKGQQDAPRPASITEIWDRTAAAYAAGDNELVLQATATLGQPLSSVSHVRVAYLRGLALWRTGEIRPAVEAILRAARAAQTLGWIRAALGAYGDGAQLASQCSAWPEALGALQAAQQIQNELGDAIGAARSLAAVGFVQEKRGLYEEAVATQQRALDALVALGDAVGAVKTRSNMSIAHLNAGAYEQARAGFEEALTYWEGVGEKGEIAGGLGHLALVKEKQGFLLEALELLQRVLKMNEDARDDAAIARTGANIANVLDELGDYLEALRIQERVLRFEQQRQDPAGEARTLGNIGVLYGRLADYQRALSYQRQALKLRRTQEDARGEANSLGNIAIILHDLGDFAGALRHHEMALEIQDRIHDRVGIANTTGSLGRLYTDLGDHEKAVRTLERAVATWQSLGNRAGAAASLNHLGIALHRAGDLEAALSAQRAAARQWETIQSKSGFALTSLRMGMLLSALGRRAAALPMLRTAEKQGEALGDADFLTRVRIQIALVLAAMGKGEQARLDLEEAVRVARELRITPVLVRAQGALARLLLKGGDAQGSLAEAKAAMRELEPLLGGLAETEGGAARQHFVDVFDAGVLAAFALDDKEEAFLFLENKRAGSLLETLRGRRALRWTDLPEALRKKEAEAQAAELRAQHELERALQLRVPQPEAHAAAVRLDEARDRLRAVSESIQRDAKRQAGLFYPRATSLRAFRTVLPPVTTFVSYGLCGEEAVALVVDPKKTRLVRLGPVAAIEEALETFDPENPEGDAAPGAAALTTLLVTPLELPASSARVLIAPDGALAYLPFGLLLPGRVVSFVPSGTTFRYLQEEQTRDPLAGTGTGVLALGDPHYDAAADSDPAGAAPARGGLRRLPDSRKEVTAIATVPLLGAQANERALHEALARKPRWRSVHFACHGLVDARRPMLTKLALTPEGKNDGFLTCMEVLREEIPAELVVLSACRTMRGRIYEGEGVVGFMRMFMYAGAPRVISSLWKVDDAATLALMKKFYALWNPPEGKGLDAAAALERAQAYVRAQEQWKHPYYWGAWVLWGLPE
jgi:tetratricopeptide (TPR) repeat protein